MKTTVIWFVTFLAIVSLFVFQARILIDSYQSKKEDIELHINSLLRSSVENEVRGREEMMKKKSIEVYHSETYKEDTAYYHNQSIYFNVQEIFEAGISQQLIHYHSGLPFNFQMLDSIFYGMLQKEKIAIGYCLYFRDSTGVTIEQTKDLPPARLNKAFKTDSLLIIDGKRVQAFVVISPPAVYKQMSGMILSSVLVVFILFFCIGYLTKTIFTQDKLNKLKNDFINTFTHNIKSPLGTIKTVLLILIKGRFEGLPEKKEKFEKTGMAQIENLLLQAEQILTVAKLEEGQSVLYRSNTDMNVMMKELTERFSVSTDKQITIRTSVAIDNDMPVHIDRLLIKEAISNLIDNAVKYSGDPVEIKIDCDIIDNTLRVRVTDNGYGISQKDQLRIFDKFERGAAVKRKEAKGFGLGLNYVQRITEAHGGVVSLCSHVGKGSEFMLLLPILSE